MRITRTTPAILPLLLVAVVFAAITRSAHAAEGPNIVFAIADDWGWPHAGAYGDAVVKTPTFDRIARDGVLLTNAYISSPSCTPSRGAIVTGQHFFRLRAGANLWSHWPAGEFPQYPAMLAAAGYHTGSFRKGWGPGDPHGVNPAGKRYQSVDAFFAARPDGAPFCLWFGASDPHRPYEPGTGAASGMDVSKVQRFPWFPDTPAINNDIADYYYEVQRFDRELGELLARIEAAGELDNTLVIVTGDHGMPFPRGKGNVYDAGARIPMAVMWPARIPTGRTITDFVSTTDLAPTFLEAAGIDVPAVMTGRSLLPVLATTRSGRVDPARDHVVIGRERHVVAQQMPETGGYPIRAIRTDDYLYIRNFEPDRWPAGTPVHIYATRPNAWLADCDNGPTKTFLWNHRHDPVIGPMYDLCFAKRPAEELYVLSDDPHQLRNVAADPAMASVRARLADRLNGILAAADDPRLTAAGGAFFDSQPYLGGAPTWPPR